MAKKFATNIDLVNNELLNAVAHLSAGDPGGTSDGRFIATTGAQVLELGPLNASIHKLNEEVRVDDLPLLTATYRRLLEKLLVQ